MADFAFSASNLDETSAVLRLSGNPGQEDAIRLDEEFGRLLASGITGLILDIPGLDGLTSAALGAVMNLSRELRERNGRLIVAAPRPKILGLIEMLGLLDRLKLAENLEQAKAELAAGD
ncbi:MAG: STAS domain-containing protein [Planctomycetota bacterium]|jgi:anti-sigma B factor antagonist|nr:STAS domain-containing protein [Planctomycetota bacterium]